MTDREEVRRWADENDHVPVRRTDVETNDGSRSELVRRDQMRDHHEEHEWDTFLDEFERNNLALVHDEEGEPRLVDRAELGSGDSAVSSMGERTTEDEVAEELAEGETVESKVTEREVVETEIVEEATIESEVVGRETVHREVVDTEIVGEEIVDIAVVDETTADVVDGDGLVDEDGRRSLHDDAADERIAIADRGGVLLEIDEERTETIEEIEELIVESRVVDTDRSETTRAGDESIDIDIDVAGIHDHIEESGILDAGSDAVIDERHIETEFDENDRATSTITEAKTIENVIEERKTVLAEITDVDVDDRRVVSETVIDTEFVEPGTTSYEGTTLDRDVATDDRTTETTETTDRDATADTADTAGGDDADDTTAAERTAADDRDAGWSDEDVTERLMGKEVETPEGKSVGIVSDVDEEAHTIYVDEDPSMTDKLKASLHWGGDDEDAAVLTADQVRELESGVLVVKERELEK